MLALLAVGAFFLIGGVAKIGGGSAPYHRSVNGSFAAQAWVLANRSNRAASDLRAVLDSFGSPALARAQLQQHLDALVADTRAQRAAAAASVPPYPAGGGPGLAGAFTDRAAAAEGIRAAVDGLLGMGPLPVAGAPGSPSPVTAAPRSATGPGGAPPATPVTLAASAVQARFSQAGALLAESDRSYAALRRAFRGTAALPRSSWTAITGPLDPARVAGLVGALRGSRSLAPAHSLALLDVRLDPGVLPAVGQHAASVIPPSARLLVTVVVANFGNVPEPGVVVTAAVAPSGAGVSESVRRTVSLDPGTSVVEILDPLGVQPGATFRLTVSVVPASGPPGPRPRTVTVQVAPSNPTVTAPPTTTTQAPPTTSPRTTTSTQRP
jgi:hypothetical protein